jgi:hypothetical protein
VFEAVKMVGIIRFGMNYPAIGLIFSILIKAVPSLVGKRKSHMRFTEERVHKRLSLQINRKDLVAFASL